MKVHASRRYKPEEGTSVDLKGSNLRLKLYEVSTVAGSDAVSSQEQEEVWCREMHRSYSIFVGTVVRCHCCTGEWKTLG